jgi:hypothetical protein
VAAPKSKPWDGWFSSLTGDPQRTAVSYPHTEAGGLSRRVLAGDIWPLEGPVHAEADL